MEWLLAWRIALGEFPQEIAVEEYSEAEREKKQGRAWWFLGVISFLWILLLGYALSLEAATVEDTRTGRPADFVEYERLVLGMKRFYGYEEFQDNRMVWLRNTEYFEAFLKQYPHSVLVPQVKLRLAELYINVMVEFPEFDLIREEHYLCAASAGTVAEAERCYDRFYLRTAFRPRDPVYVKKAIQLLDEIYISHGTTPHYAWADGVFRYRDDEDLAGVALYTAAKAAKPKDRAKLYTIILQKHKLRPDLREEVAEFLKNFKKQPAE